MNLYKHHTEREIRAVLEHSDKLTYDAQINLLNTIGDRGIQASTETLELQISIKEKAINDLEHLEDLGFVFNQDSARGTISLNRTTRAKTMDIVSVVLGTVLFLGGLIHLWLLLAVFFGDNEFTLTKLFTYVLMISAGLIGLKMLSGINRFLDYRTFSLVQAGDTVTIEKGGLKGEQSINLDELILEEEEEGELVLSARNIEIMRAAEDNLVHKRTLESLLLKMTTNR